ncbi:hypothetical protein SS50377_22153 [Spironucleus salmonicida]|uniref:Uncharacterized protein n=1 Tax=Spironucleus salmonicida TaxID=348837 RepID=V6LN88_9EUKA|nr:hypothetical protein SS50377_22153 [Spironucleus salmonicida]|eukprot:EST45688.1 Hypothetical protein SS50377_jh013 [Spironucleus salmonicida]
MKQIFLEEALVYLTQHIDVSIYEISSNINNVEKIFKLLDKVYLLKTFSAIIISVIKPLFLIWDTLKEPQRLDLLQICFSLNFDEELELNHYLDEIQIRQLMNQLSDISQQALSKYIIQTRINNIYISSLILYPEQYYYLDIIPPFNVEIANGICKFQDQKAGKIINQLIQISPNNIQSKKQFYSKISQEKPSYEFFIQNMFEFYLYSYQNIQNNLLPLNSFLFKYLSKVQPTLSEKIKLLDFTTFAINEAIAFQIMQNLFTNEYILNNMNLFDGLQISQLNQFILQGDKIIFSKDIYEKLSGVYQQVYGLLMAEQQKNYNYSLDYNCLDQIAHLEISQKYKDIIFLNTKSSIINIYLNNYLTLRQTSKRTLVIIQYCEFYDIIRKVHIPTWKQIDNFVKLDISIEYFTDILILISENIISNDIYGYIYFIVAKATKAEKQHIQSLSVENLVLSINQTFILINDDSKKILLLYQQQIQALANSKQNLHKIMIRLSNCIENSSLTLLYQRKIVTYFFQSIQIVSSYDDLFNTIITICQINFSQTKKLNPSNIALKVQSYDTNLFIYKNYLEQFFHYFITDLNQTEYFPDIVMILLEIFESNRYQVNILDINLLVDYSLSFIIAQTQRGYQFNAQEIGVLQIIKSEMKIEIQQQYKSDQLNILVNYLSNYTHELLQDSQIQILQILKNRQ